MIFERAKSCQITARNGSNVSSSKIEPYLSLQITSGPYVKLFEPLKSHNFKIQAQENNKVRLFEEMRNVSVPSE